MSYTNILYLKRTHFWCEIEIFENCTRSYNKRIEKNWIFPKAQFHIGVLCSKTLGRFRQSLKWSYQKNFCIFPNIIFQKILNLAKKVEKYQVCHFCQIWSTLMRIRVMRIRVVGGNPVSNSDIGYRDWCKKKRTGLDLAMKMDAFSIFWPQWLLYSQMSWLTFQGAQSI